MEAPQDQLLENMMACLAGEAVCSVEDDTKQALANCVRKHYRAHPEAIRVSNLTKDRPTTLITLRIPVDVVESMKAIAPL